MRIKKQDYTNFVLLEFWKDNIYQGCVEVIEESHCGYIDNMVIPEALRGRGLFRKIITQLKEEYKTLECLPLSHHRKKFEHLGFKVIRQENEEDIIYSLS